MTTVQVRDLLVLYGYPMLFLASLIEGTGMPGPIELFFVASGVLIARGDMTLLDVWAIGTVGNVLGNLIGYGIGRWGGRPLFYRIVRRLHLKESSVHRTEGWFKSFGGMAQAISRLIGVTRTPAILGAGVMHAPLLPFVIGSLIGDAIWSMFWTLAGVGVGAYMPFVREHEWLAIVVAVGVIVIGGAVWYLIHRKLRNT